MNTRFEYVFVIFFFIFGTSCQNKNKNYDQLDINSLGKTTSDDLLHKNMNDAYNNENYSKALNYLEALIKKDSTNGEYYYKKGYSESQLYKFKKSIEAYEKAIKYNYKIVSATFNIGVTYKLKSDSLAKLYFEKCLIIDPNYEPAKVQLSVIKNYYKKKMNN